MAEKTKPVEYAYDKFSYQEIQFETEEGDSLGNFFLNHSAFLSDMHGCTVHINKETGVGTLTKHSQSKASRGWGTDKAAAHHVSAVKENAVASVVSAASRGMRPREPEPTNERPSASSQRHGTRSKVEDDQHGKMAAQWDEQMTTQDRYIDARLAGIEKDLDNRLADMQRQSDQADKRLDKALAEMRADSKMTRTTVITTSVAVVGLVAAILYGTLTAFQQTVSEQGEAMRQSVSEQSDWLRQSVDRIERRVETIPASLSPEDQAPPSQGQDVPTE